jgi:predicted dehydrogenase
VEIVSVVDPVPGKALSFAEQFRIKHACESLEMALAHGSLDFVDIATRPEAHLPLVCQAAGAGMHVICQKPMAPTWDECVAMVEACESAGVRLLIHENWRWQPWYREAKRLLESNRLGHPFQISFFWRTGDGRGPEPYTVQPYFRTMPRLLVYETLVHVLDTFRFLFGEMESLSCEMARLNPVIAGEDHALIQIKFASGSLGFVDGNRISGPVPTGAAMGSLVIEGDRGTLRMTTDGQLWFTEFGQPEVRLAFDPPTNGYKGDSVFATQKHLLECLRSGGPSESDGRDYLRTVAAVWACYQSAETGQSVRFGEFRSLATGKEFQ